MLLTRRPLLAVAAVAAAAFFALPAAATQADVLASSDCTPAPSLQVFLPWGDPAFYSLVPGGDGSLTGWTLAGGAAQGPGSGLFGDSASLLLPAGAGALSPAACVNVPSPTVEISTQSNDPGATVTVYAVFQRTNGRSLVEQVASVPAASTWAPSGPLSINPPQATKNGNLLIALAFTANGGNVQVDDVYIDPWRWCC